MCIYYFYIMSNDNDDDGNDDDGGGNGDMNDKVLELKWNVMKKEWRKI